MLRIELCAEGADPVRIPHSEIEELALQAESVGIFALANTRVVMHPEFNIREGKPQAFPIGEGGPLAVDEV